MAVLSMVQVSTSTLRFIYVQDIINQNQNMQCMTTDYTYTGGNVLRDSPRRELRTESVSVQVSQVWSRLPTEALALQ